VDSVVAVQNDAVQNEFNARVRTAWSMCRRAEIG
jgi:hypothetical protein